MNNSATPDGAYTAPEAVAPKGLMAWLKHALIAEPPKAQGVHLDPLEQPAPDPAGWSPDHRAAWFSPQMEVFRSALRHGDLDIRDAVLADLSEYHGFTPEECRRRCLHWERWSVEEWTALDRSSPEALRDFYNSVQSWSFDLLWYAYLQTAGFGFPASVVAARHALAVCPGGAHLDFGSGVGTTSQLFDRLGFTTSSADISRPLINFAKWRLERRGDQVRFLDLNSDRIPANSYDVVTAIDALVHVDNFDDTVNALHAAIRPGGWLLTNFDIRAKGADESAWHLHDNSLELEYKLQRTGFVLRNTLGGITLCYQRTEPRSIVHFSRTMRDRALLRPPLGAATGLVRRLRWPTPRRLANFVKRAATKPFQR